MITLSVEALSGGSPLAMDAGPKLRPVRAKAEKILRPVPPSAAIQAMYQKKLLGLIDEMAKSTQYWVEATYRGNPPEIAQDELASAALRRAIQELTRRWTKRFDEAADKLAKYFALKVADRNDRTLRKILKDGGFSIDFKLTAAQRDVLNATVHENVSLIKSIPREYLTNVEGLVMRSVQAGRQMSALTEALEKQFGVTKRRAILIARDQNSKASGALNRVRQLEIGGSAAEAVWIHSGNVAHARKSHLKAGQERTRFRVSDGWFDPEVGQHIQPGFLINCRCYSRLIVPGFS